MFFFVFLYIYVLAFSMRWLGDIKGDKLGYGSVVMRLYSIIIKGEVLYICPA